MKIPEPEPIRLSQEKVYRWPDDMPPARPQVPGENGSVGPFRGQYDRPHVYARDVYSGAGNCVCGRSLGDSKHTEAAPGVPVPDRLAP